MNCSAVLPDNPPWDNSHLLASMRSVFSSTLMLFFCARPFTISLKSFLSGEPKYTDTPNRAESESFSATVSLV